MLTLEKPTELNQPSFKAKLNDYFKRAFATNRLLTLTGLVMLVVLVGTIGWLISRSRNIWLTTGHKVILVWTAGLAYLGWIVILVWQALRGQSINAPDGATLAATGGLVLIVGLVVAGVFGQARQSNDVRAKLN